MTYSCRRFLRNLWHVLWKNDELSTALEKQRKVASGLKQTLENLTESME